MIVPLPMLLYETQCLVVPILGYSMGSMVAQNCACQVVVLSLLVVILSLSVVLSECPVDL